MEDLITGEVFIQALRKAGIVPDEARNVSIRASVGEPVTIIYDGVEDDEPVVTTRRLTRADAEGLGRLDTTLM